MEPLGLTVDDASAVVLVMLEMRLVGPLAHTL
jgi:hypothetical protein